MKRIVPPVPFFITRFFFASLSSFFSKFSILIGSRNIKIPFSIPSRPFRPVIVLFESRFVFLRFSAHNLPITFIHIDFSLLFLVDCALVCLLVHMHVLLLFSIMYSLLFFIFRFFHFSIFNLQFFFFLTSTLLLVDFNASVDRPQRFC